MYASFHFPDLALHCLLAGSDEHTGQPVALLSEGEREKSHLTAINEIARSYGLTRGMRTTHALCRCADLVFLDRDVHAEKKARTELIDFAESFTPDFELTTPESLVLDLSTLLFDSSQAWIEHALRRAIYLGLPLHLAIDETPDFAHLRSLSRRTSAWVAHDRELELHLSGGEVDIFSLRLAEIHSPAGFYLPQQDLLKLWGIDTLGDLAALPRQGLGERLGRDLLRIHDILHKKPSRLLKLERPSQNFASSHGFETPVENFEPILFVARRLFQALCNRLRANQRATRQIDLALNYEDGPTYRKTLKLSEETLDPNVLLRSLHTQLDGLRAIGRVEAFELELIAVVPRQKQQDIFHRGLKDAGQFADTLQQVSALVGHDRVGVPQIADTHRPDRFSLTPLDVTEKKTPLACSQPCHHLAMSRFRPAVEVSVVTEKREGCDVPLAVLTGPHQGHIQSRRGPFPLSGSWWERTWQEMQWDAELEGQVLVQLTQKSATQWELNGIYGG